jgi:hypothetical protein
MIRAREQEGLPAASSSPASSSPASKKPRLGDRVRMPVEHLLCSLCDGNLDRNYSYLECDHKLCGCCTDNIKAPNGVTCPMCRAVSLRFRQIPLLTEILMDAPRKVLCGKVVEGWLGEDEHFKCSDCLLARVMELEEENAALKKSNTSRLNKIEYLQDRVDQLEKNNRDRHRRQVNVSVLESEEDDSDTE